MHVHTGTPVKGVLEAQMSFGIYLVGYIVLIIGLCYGAYLAHLPSQWIGVGVLVMLGLGILTAVTRTRQKDPN